MKNKDIIKSNISDTSNDENFVKNSKVPTSETELNYSVYNTLNLMSPTLGECYKDDGYNPFPQDYAMSEEEIGDILQLKKTCKKIEKAPDFIDMGVKQSRLSFKLALQNTTILKDAMIKKAINSDTLSRKHCDKIILYLKNREALLNKFLSKMSSRSNVLEMLQELYDLDPRLAEMLKSTFYKNFNLQIALDNLVLFIMQDMENNPIEETENTNTTEVENKLESIKDDAIYTIEEIMQASKKNIADAVLDEVKELSNSIERFGEASDSQSQTSKESDVNSRTSPEDDRTKQIIDEKLAEQLINVKKDRAEFSHGIEINSLNSKLGNIHNDIKKDKNAIPKTKKPPIHTYDDDGMSL